MQAQLQKKKNFFILYIILAAANFFYKIFNLIRHSVLTGFTVTEFFAYFGRAVLYMLPLVAFIFISKKTAEIENMEKHLKIKKYVTAYLIVSPVYGVWNIFLTDCATGIFRYFRHAFFIHQAGCPIWKCWLSIIFQVQLLICCLKYVSWWFQ